MGLGKITRGAGKVAGAAQVAILLYDLGEALIRRIRGRRSADPAPDGARAGGDPERHPAGDDRADDQQLQP